MAEPKRVYLRNRAGERYSVPEGELDAALSDSIDGFRLESPEEAREEEIQKKYGSTGQQLLTGAETAASALTLGLSTHAERALGVPAEDIAGREEANPISAGVGTAVGIAAPLIASGGLSGAAAGTRAAAVRGAAELTAPALISRVGTAVGKGAKALLPGAEGLVGQMAVKGLAAGAAGAAEGALYSAGTVIHEQALGNPHLTAQSALSEVGLSAALFGGLGALGAAGSVGLGRAVTRAREATAKVTGRLREAFPTGERFATSVGEQYEGMEAALRRANAEFRPAETEALGLASYAKGEVSPTAVREAYAGVVDRVSQAAEAMRAKPELFPQRFAVRLEEGASALVRDVEEITKNPATAFRRLNKFKQSLDDVIKFDRIPSEESMEAIGALKSLRSDVRTILESESVFGAAGSRQAAFNEAQSEYLAAKKNFEKYFTTKSSAVGGPVRRINPSALDSLGKDTSAKGVLRQEAFDAYSAASQKLLDEIEQSAAHAPTGVFDRKAMGALVEKSDELLKGVQRGAALAQAASFLSGGAGLAGGLGVGAMVGGPVGAAIGAGLHVVAKAAEAVPRAVEVLSKLQAANKAVGKQVEKAMAAVATGGKAAAEAVRPTAAGTLVEEMGRVQRFAADPEHLTVTLARNTAGLQAHAPGVAQAMQTTAVRAVTYLAAQVPATPKVGPFGPQLKPSPEQVAVFARSWEAVYQPLSVLRHLQAGTLTPQHVAALQAVHPQLLAEMRAKAIDQLAAKPGMPYRARLMLSLFLGTDLDGTMRPASILQAQQTYRGPSAKPQDAQVVGPTAAGASKLSVASRTMTPLQRGANRED